MGHNRVSLFWAAPPALAWRSSGHSGRIYNSRSPGLIINKLFLHLNMSGVGEGGGRGRAGQAGRNGPESNVGGETPAGMTLWL